MGKCHFSSNKDYTSINEIRTEQASFNQGLFFFHDELLCTKVEVKNMFFCLQQSKSKRKKKQEKSVVPRMHMWWCYSTKCERDKQSKQAQGPCPYVMDKVYANLRGPCTMAKVTFVQPPWPDTLLNLRGPCKRDHLQHKAITLYPHLQVLCSTIHLSKNSLQQKKILLKFYNVFSSIFCVCYNFHQSRLDRTVVQLCKPE